MIDGDDGDNDGLVPPHMWTGRRQVTACFLPHWNTVVWASAMANEDQKLEPERVVGEESWPNLAGPDFFSCDRSSSRMKGTRSAWLRQKQRLKVNCHRYCHRHPCQLARGLYEAEKFPTVRPHSYEIAAWDIPWDCWILLRPPQTTIWSRLVQAPSDLASPAST